MPFPFVPLLRADALRGRFDFGASGGPLDADALLVKVSLAGASSSSSGRRRGLCSRRLCLRGGSAGGKGVPTLLGVSAVLPSMSLAAS